jgi:hypothetical protein
MASSTPTTRRVLSEINVNTPTPRGALLSSKLGTGSPAKSHQGGETSLQPELGENACGTIYKETSVRSLKRNSEGGSDGLPSKRYRTTPSPESAREAILGDLRRGQSFGVGNDAAAEPPSPPSRVRIYRLA